MWWLTGVIKDQVKTKNDLVHIALLLGLGHLKLLEMIPSVQTLCDPVDYSPPGSSVHGVLQARILQARFSRQLQEWVAMPFSRGSSQPRDGTQVSHCRRILYCLRLNQ